MEQLDIEEGIHFGAFNPFEEQKQQKIEFGFNALEAAVLLPTEPMMKLIGDFDAVSSVGYRFTDVNLQMEKDARVKAQDMLVMGYDAEDADKAKKMDHLGAYLKVDETLEILRRMYNMLHLWCGRNSIANDGGTKTWFLTKIKKALTHDASVLYKTYVTATFENTIKWIAQAYATEKIEHFDHMRAFVEYEAQNPRVVRGLQTLDLALSLLSELCLEIAKTHPNDAMPTLLLRIANKSEFAAFQNRSGELMATYLPLAIVTYTPSTLAGLLFKDQKEEDKINLGLDNDDSWKKRFKDIGNRAFVLSVVIRDLRHRFIRGLVPLDFVPPVPRR